MYFPGFLRLSQASLLQPPALHLLSEEGKGEISFTAGPTGLTSPEGQPCVDMKGQRRDLCSQTGLPCVSIPGAWRAAELRNCDCFSRGFQISAMSASRSISQRAGWERKMGTN